MATTIANLTNDENAIKPSCLKLVQVIGEDRLSVYDMLGIMGFASRSSFTKTYLKPAMAAGLILLEYPDSPNAPNQRYGLTLKGKAIYYESLNNNYEGQNGRRMTQVDPQNDPQRMQVDPQKKAVIEAIKENNKTSRIALARIIGCSESSINRNLREWNIAWLGHPKTGHWVFVKDIQ